MLFGIVYGEEACMMGAMGFLLITGLKLTKDCPHMRLCHTGCQRNIFSLKDVNKRFPYPQLLRYALQLAKALQYLHDDAIPGTATPTCFGLV